METTLDVKAGMQRTRRVSGGRERRETIEALLRARRRRREGPPAAGRDTPDPIDIAREREEEAVWLAVLERSDELHQAAAEALDRLEAGRYGQCVGCGRQIAPGRLQAMPFTVRCLACQEGLERRAAIRRHTSLVLEVEP